MKICVMPIEEKAGCLLYSFAAVLEAEPVDLMDEIGHNGMTKIWPELVEPYCYQGFHIQELTDCAISRGYSVTEIQAMPTSLPPPSAYLHMVSHNVGPHIYLQPSDCAKRFRDHLQGVEAVLYGTTRKGGTHAWAWDGTHAHDCRSGHGASLLIDLKIMNAWLLRSNQ